MRSAALFVEGIADVKFLQDFVQYHFGQTLKDGQHIVKCSGNGGLAAQASTFTQFALQGLTNCIIFDADTEAQETDFAGTKDRISKELASITQTIHTERPDLPVQFDVFLLPNNHDNGDLETLLERIINPENQPLLDCWNAYEQCILAQQERIPSRTLSVPIRKSKIYSYMEILHGTSNQEREQAKEKNRDYTMSEDWLLNHNAAQNLHTFLARYFSSTPSPSIP
ncbi:MAG: hypothetical protein EAZ92_15660 [Candidatus Kapaibacterium sp.]|nr:MAG: hypothetical protein EAZ92_15660 [Candidatus Kapabacteria bacterium]